MALIEATVVCFVAVGIFVVYVVVGINVAVGALLVVSIQIIFRDSELVIPDRVPLTWVECENFLG